LVDTGVCTSDGTWDVKPRSFTCPGGYQIDDDDSWDNLSPKIGLEYDLTDYAMTYASWTRAFRSGGWSYRASARELERQRPGYYDEERVDAYELGLKSDWWDGRLRANVAAWFHDFKDLQRSVFASEVLADGSLEYAQFFTNVPDAEAYGLEIELTAELLRDALLANDSLVFELAWGNTEYEYKSDVDLDGDGEANDSDFPWQQIPDYPWNTALNSRHDFFAGSVAWRVAYSYVDEVNATGITDFPMSWYKDRERVDASARFDSADGKWYLALFARNLTDEEDYQFMTPFTPDFGIGQPMQDRTWGITAGFKL